MSLFNTSILRLRKAGEFKISFEDVSDAPVSSDEVASASFSCSASRHVEGGATSEDREDTNECGRTIAKELVGSVPRNKTPKILATERIIVAKKLADDSRVRIIAMADGQKIYCCSCRGGFDAFLFLSLVPPPSQLF